MSLQKMLLIGLAGAGAAGAGLGIGTDIFSEQGVQQVMQHINPLINDVKPMIQELKDMFGSGLKEMQENVE